MKKIGRKSFRVFAVLLGLVMMVTCLGSAYAAPATGEAAGWKDLIPQLLSAGNFREGSALVQYRGLSREAAEGIRTLAGREVRVSVLQETGDGKLLAEVACDGMTAEELLCALAGDSRVEWAEPDYLAERLEAAETGEENQDEEDDFYDLDLEGRLPQKVTPYEEIPNMAPYQWGMTDESVMRDVALKGGEPAAVSAHAFPDLSGTGSNMEQTVYVAVLDEFADYTNPDLTPVMIHFTPEEQEILGCGEWGFNATTYNNGGQTEKDFLASDHGTHCAGLLGGAWDGKGISGMASNVKILAVQVTDPVLDRLHPDDGMPMGLSSVLRGIAFVDRYNAYYAGVAPEKMIRIISMSLGYEGTDRLLNTALLEIGQKYGVLTFIAAGNDGTNNDVTLDNSSSLRENPYVFNVAAMNQAGYLADYSNYGPNTVTLASPGSAMLSTIQMSAANYFPGFIREGEYKDLWYEDFSNYTGESLKVVQSGLADGTENAEAEVSLVSSSWSGGKALAIKLDPAKYGLSQMRADDVNQNEQFGLCISVKLTKEQAESIRKAGTDAQFGIIFSGNVAMPKDSTMVRLRDAGTESAMLSIQRNFINRSGSWSVISSGPHKEDYQNLSSIFPEGELQEYILDFDFTFIVMGEMDTFYIDSLGIGTNGVPYAIYDGTSMATPAAAGAAAVYVSRHPEEDGKQLAARIRASVTKSDELKDLVVTGGRIDLANDVSAAWTDPGPVKPSWPLYETTLPLDTSTGTASATDAPGDAVTYGSFLAEGGKLWYIPTFMGFNKKEIITFVHPEIRCFDPEKGEWGETVKIPGGPLWELSACVWNGEIWIYGRSAETLPDGSYRVNGTVDSAPRLLSFRPETMTFTEHSLQGFARPGAYTLFAGTDGLMIFDNDVSGIDGDEDEEKAFEEGLEKMTVYAYDPEKGMGDKVAEYPEYVRDVQIVTHGDATWIVDMESNGTNSRMFRLQNGTITRVGFTLPYLLLESNPMYTPGTNSVKYSDPSNMYKQYKAVVAGEKGIYFVGYPDKGRTADTWLLPWDATEAVPLEKHMSVLRPFAVSAVLYNGTLYAIGTDWGEHDSSFFRATKVEGE